MVVCCVRVFQLFSSFRYQQTDPVYQKIKMSASNRVSIHIKISPEMQMIHVFQRNITGFKIIDSPINSS